MKHAARRYAFASLLIGLFLSPAPGAETQVFVAEELERLMQEHGFEMKPQDLEMTRATKGRAEGDTLLPRLRMLLESFDHVIIQTPTGGVERVIILGEKVPYTPPPEVASGENEEGAEGDQPPAEGEIVLDTQRKGASHTLSLMLEGDGGKRVPQVLLLDTGAEFVVLPASLVEQLGIDPKGLRKQQIQTANGSVEAQVGSLAAVWLGETRISGVNTAFIDDDKLGGNALLGMSVLGRFRVTIDDDNNQVVLAGK